MSSSPQEGPPPDQPEETRLVVLVGSADAIDTAEGLIKRLLLVDFFPGATKRYMAGGVFGGSRAAVLPPESSRDYAAAMRAIVGLSTARTADALGAALRAAAAHNPRAIKGLGRALRGAHERLAQLDPAHEPPAVIAGEEEEDDEAERDTAARGAAAGEGALPLPDDQVAAEPLNSSTRSFAEAMRGLHGLTEVAIAKNAAIPGAVAAAGRMAGRPLAGRQGAAAPRSALSGAAYGRRDGEGGTVSAEEREVAARDAAIAEGSVGSDDAHAEPSLSLQVMGRLSAETRAAFAARGITSLFPIQLACFELIHSGRDVVGRARTGMGKTLAFVLPVVERVRAARRPAQLAHVRAVSSAQSPAGVKETAIDPCRREERSMERRPASGEAEARTPSAALRASEAVRPTQVRSRRGAVVKCTHTCPSRYRHLSPSRLDRLERCVLPPGMGHVRSSRWPAVLPQRPDG